MNIPVLMLTLNRFEFAKQAIESALNIRGISLFVIDDGSNLKNQKLLHELLQEHYKTFRRPRYYFFPKTEGIASRMNFFLELTEGSQYCGKIDSDTICQPDWAEKMLPFMEHADMIQSKHHIIPATHPDGWEGFTLNMTLKNGLLYNHFIGGSGIIFNREKVQYIPETEWKLGGWRKFQLENPELKKAFVPSVEIKLLDETGYPEQYKSYYQQTGRL